MGRRKKRRKRKGTRRRHAGTPRGRSGSRGTGEARAREREEDLFEAFVREVGPARPDRVVAVLSASTRECRCKGDFVAGRWLLHAPLEVDEAWIPGYRAARVYQTIERFVRWMHRRGHLSDWERRRLSHALDDARRCHFLRDEPPGPRGLERPIHRGDLDGIAERFGPTLTHPVERDMARSTLRLAATWLEVQLGAGGLLPFGALDVDRLVRDVWVSELGEEPESVGCFFGVLARFYEWLGVEERLDPARAKEQAARLSAASLGTQAALSA
ncbi:MAG TPA: hypothetical protein RMH99_11650 [Sandaracinaceae bacterium LLY-WYZ-13_1]|nr:hypothetical protein [Sandaracinaceae bacterium LLY-WYZ-13_1]